MKTMQPLISEKEAMRPFQAYYCPECDEIRWCQPGKPECWTGPVEGAEHELIPAWVER